MDPHRCSRKHHGPDRCLRSLLRLSNESTQMATRHNRRNCPSHIRTNLLREWIHISPHGNGLEYRLPFGAVWETVISFEEPLEGRNDEKNGSLKVGPWLVRD